MVYYERDLAQNIQYTSNSITREIGKLLSCLLEFGQSGVFLKMSWPISIREKAKMKHVILTKPSKHMKSRMVVRISAEAHQGGRRYMEDLTSTLYDRQRIGRDIGQTYVAVYDGHGGCEAAYFAKAMLWNTIKKQRGFYSHDPTHVAKAIKEGFLATHRAMWKQLGKLFVLEYYN